MCKVSAPTIFELPLVEKKQHQVQFLGSQQKSKTVKEKKNNI